MNKREIGSAYEEKAAVYLMRNGFQVLEEFLLQTGRDRPCGDP